MRALRRLFTRLRNIATGFRGDDRLREEMEQHFALQTDENMRAGMSPTEARRQARLKLGGAESIREDYHAEEGLPLIENLMHDARFTLRILRKSPGFTLAAVFTLALGIGACTAIFSAVNPIFFEPLPYPHASRILTIWNTFKGERSRLAFGNWRELAERNHSFEALSACEPWQPVLVGGAEPVRLNGQRVSATYLRVLGVEPWLGRDFLPAEDRYHGPAVAILSYRLWQQKLGGDRGIIGAVITLDGDRYTVIGVMPAGFENVLSSQADVWTLLDYDVQALATDFESGEWGNHLYMVGRVRPGMSHEAAAQDLETIAANPITQFPHWARPAGASLALCWARA